MVYSSSFIIVFSVYHWFQCSVVAKWHNLKQCKTKCYVGYINWKETRNFIVLLRAGGNHTLFSLPFYTFFLSCYWQGVKQTEWKKFSSNGCSPCFANVKSDYLRKDKHQTISPTSQNLATILRKKNKKEKKINLSFSSCVWTSERVKLNSLRDSIYFPCPTLVTWRK